MDPTEFSQMDSEDETLSRLMFFGSFPSVHLGIYVQLWREGDRKVAGRLEDGFFGWARDWGGMELIPHQKSPFKPTWHFRVFSLPLGTASPRWCKNVYQPSNVIVHSTLRPVVDWLIGWWIGWRVLIGLVGWLLVGYSTLSKTNYFQHTPKTAE